MRKSRGGGIDDGFKDEFIICFVGYSPSCPVRRLFIGGLTLLVTNYQWFTIGIVALGFISFKLVIAFLKHS